MSRRNQAGFTLLELMITVTIIGVVAALAVPGITVARAERSTSKASYDLVRLLRRGRSEAAAYGRAHIVRYTAVADGARGNVLLFRGQNNGCNANDWGTITTGGCTGNPYCLDAWRGMNFENTDYKMRVRVPGHNPLDICFEPSGITRYRRGASPRFTDVNAEVIDGGFRFAVYRYRAGTPTLGVRRWVMLPLGGDPRTLQ